MSKFVLTMLLIDILIYVSMFFLFLPSFSEAPSFLIITNLIVVGNHMLFTFGAYNETFRNFFEKEST